MTLYKVGHHNFQVERVLEQRAISVNLHPEIEDSCRDFLVQNCAQATGNGEEIKCLQVRALINFPFSICVFHFYYKLMSL